MISTPILNRAMEALPHYVAAKRAQAALAPQAQRIRQDVTTVSDHELVQEAHAAVLAGGDLPTDLADRLVEDEHRRAANVRLHGLLRTLEDRLSSELKLRRSDDPTPAFDVLRAELDDVVAQVAVIDDALGAVSTVEDAISDLVAAGDWARLDALVGRYDQLRSAQQRLTAAATGASGPDLQRLMRAGLVQVDHDPDEPPWPRPRPRTDTPTVWWPTHDRPAYLRWLASSGATPILPDPGEAEDLAAAAHAAAFSISSEPYRNPDHYGGRPARPGDLVTDLTTTHACG